MSIAFTLGRIIYANTFWHMFLQVPLTMQLTNACWSFDKVPSLTLADYLWAIELRGFEEFDRLFFMTGRQLIFMLIPTRLNNK